MNVIKTALEGVKVLPAKAKFAIVKNAPVLCLGAGLATIGVGVVLACKATRKADSVINETSEFIENAKTKIGLCCSDGSEYTEEDYELDVKNEKIKRNVRVVKTYILSVCVIAAGMGLVCFGHGILANRYANAVTAFNGLMLAHNNYRARVAERLGEEAEAELYYNCKRDEEGNTYLGRPNDFSYIWDWDSPGASNNNFCNADYLSKMHAYLYRKYDTQGYLFVIDVLEELGIKPENLDSKDLKLSKIYGWKKGMTEDMNWGTLYYDFVERAAHHEYDNMDAMGVVIDFSSSRDILVSDKVWDPIGNGIVCLT